MNLGSRTCAKGSALSMDGRTHHQPRAPIESSHQRRQRVAGRGSRRRGMEGDQGQKQTTTKKVAEVGVWDWHRSGPALPLF